MNNSGDFLQWLRTFIVVAESGSLHKSADRLFLSPAAVSHHIRKLEQDLDVLLFERTSKGMDLTQIGRQLRERSLFILGEVESLHRTNSGNVEVSGPIRLTGVNKQLQSIVPHMLAFRGLHPEVKFIIEPDSPPKVVCNMLKGAFDAAVTIYGQVGGELKFVGLKPSSAYLYTQKGNPFKLPPNPTWEEICELPFISLTLDGNVNPVMLVMPELVNPQRIILTTNDFLLALQMVKNGYGVCLAPPLTSMEDPDDFSAFNIDHIFPIGTFGYLIRRNARLSPQVTAFLDFLEKTHSGEIKLQISPSSSF